MNAKRSRLGRWELEIGSWVVAATYLVAHLFTLAPSLEDIDSINFALGLHDFDPAQHQPHPPGYPIYIALGRLSLAAIHVVRSSLDGVSADALALSILSVIAGAAALVFGWRVFDALASGSSAGVRARTRRWATFLLAACPLFWVTGLRPMSDMPGLAVALACQSLLLSDRARSGAFLAGLALGVRAQTLWLTAPLIVVDLCRNRGKATWRDRAMVVACAAGGALAWAVPLVIATGGLAAYLDALGAQAGEDFSFVDMLWANPTPRRLAFGLIHTLVLPWGTYLLAAIIIGLAAVGAAVTFLRDRRALGLTIAAFAPYAAFHLVFQETITVRYALPLVPAFAFLAARALALAGRATNVLGTPLAVVGLIHAVPTAVAYASQPHPAFRAIEAASRRADVDHPGLVTSHFELRRSLRVAEPKAMPVVYAPHQHELMELVKYWSAGGTGVVWFFANPRRTDVDLIDPHSRADVVRYRWAVESRPEFSGTRPSGVDWYRMRPPNWFVGEGWALTPETGGLTQATGTGPDRQPIAGYIRRHAGPMHAMVGGRHLGLASDPPAAFEMAIDGTVVDRWTVSAKDPSFLRFVDLSSGIPGPEGSYATVTIRAAGSPAAIRQFDFQPLGRAIIGFGPGWHEDEFDPATGLRWRWTSDRAILRLHGSAGGVRVRLRGESPMKYFDSAPSLTMLAGNRLIAGLQPLSDWTWEVVVPADALAASNGDVIVQTDHVFVPSEITGSPDTRRLGLRVFAANAESVR